MLISIFNTKGSSFSVEPDQGVVSAVSLEALPYKNSTPHSIDIGSMQTIFTELTQVMNNYRDDESLPRPILVVTGGADVDPVVYGEVHRHPSTSSYIELDMFELQIIYHAMRIEMPILGICRGSQLGAVSVGGSLYQHIPDVIGDKHPYIHEVETYTDEGQTIYVENGSIPGFTTSTHHQAVKEISPRAIVHATCEDGIIECWEYPTFKMLGIQGHPEYMQWNNYYPLHYLAQKYL